MGVDDCFSVCVADQELTPWFALHHREAVRLAGGMDESRSPSKLCGRIFFSRNVA